LSAEAISDSSWYEHINFLASAELLEIERGFNVPSRFNARFETFQEPKPESQLSSITNLSSLEIISASAFHPLLHSLHFNLNQGQIWNPEQDSRA
jgi:hypothetical protein